MTFQNMRKTLCNGGDMEKYLNRKDKMNFGENIKGVGNSYNDDPEIEAFERFLKAFCISKHGKYEYEVIPKPFGEYGIDLVVRLNGVDQFYVDVEVWSEWKNDWPWFYYAIHFLERKYHFIEKYGDKFMMMYSNMNHDKFIMIKSEDIVKYQAVDKWIKKVQKYDKLRKLKFQDCVLFGNNFGEIELKRFPNIRRLIF